MKNNLTNLLKVKTIITLMITIIFCYLAVVGKMPIETTTMVIGMVFTYYFNKDKISYTVIGSINVESFNKLMEYIEKSDFDLLDITDNL